MKKNLQRIVICFLFFIFWLEGKEAKGQWVTIPDINFVTWLNANGYAGCMNGNLMDTTCNAVVNATDINCYGQNIYDLEGIQYFNQLITLGCGMNHLVNLPELPNMLWDLDCQYNAITSIYKFPDSLRYIQCSNNQLSNLPDLPSKLKVLFCWDNLLIDLPTLPITIEQLWCSSNNISNLGFLPNSLWQLGVGANQLTSLPTLPNQLWTLSCGANNLGSLPPLPSSLQGLDCNLDNLTTLPALPNSLTHLNCASNYLTTIPSWPSSLIHLVIDNNQFTSIPPLPSSLKEFYCAYNLLNSIPELPDTMWNLDISHNPALNCIPKLKTITSHFEWQNTGITCLPNFGSTANPNPSLNSVPLCQMYNMNGCQFYWNISGKVSNDANTNCIIDSGETQQQNIKLKLFQSNVLIQETFTDYLGNYSFDTDTGNFTFTVDTTDLPFYVSCPPSGFNNCYVPSNDSTIMDKDFGVVCKPGFDVGANAVVRDSGNIRPANYARIHFYAGDMSNKYGLHCASGVSGSVQVIINGNATYVSPAVNALTPTVSGDTLTYTIADFGSVNFYTDFGVVMQTDITTQAGDLICFDVSVTPVNGDNVPSNNSLTHCVTVVNSYDPNEKTVFPSNIIDDNNDKLTYTIHFQNTGNAPAQHIYILDTLDVVIDESSFELLAYSHQPQVQIIGNVVRFNFPNINLPDSVNDEPNSHGYVQYRVKLKDSLTLGTVISNTSYIYFDFNPPVQTNTVVDTLTDCNNLAAIDVINQTLCAGDTLHLDATLPYPSTTDWYVDSIFVSNNQNISIPNLSIGNHEIKLIVTNAYCNTEVVSNVLIHGLPLVDLGNDTTTCNIPVTIDAGAGNVSYQWSNGETTQAIVANLSSLYSVLVTDSNGCSNSDSVTVTINALPAQPVITQNISLLTSSYSKGNQWLMNGGIIPGAINNSYNVTLTGWYSVLVTDSNGCSNLSDSLYMDLSGVYDFSNSNGVIRIVPNPATTEFRVLGLEFRVGDVVTITDVLGRIVYHKTFSQLTRNPKLETLNYLCGVYFVNVKTSKFSAVLKLIKN